VEPQADHDGDDVTDVMRERHRVVEFLRPHIEALVRRATGADVADSTRIVRGYESEVYRATTTSGAAVVVRVRRYGSVSYASEAWAIEQCRAAGAPVPEILLLDTIATDDHSHEVMVQRAVPGRPLADIQHRLNRAELARVWAQVGEVLARIHSVQAGGFYKMRQLGVWDFPADGSVQESAREERLRDLAELQAHGVDAGDLDTLKEILDAAEGAFTCRVPSLLHGDFLPDHLFVDDDLRLQGVIDFGDFQGGPRIVDLANLHMSEPDVDLGWLRVGYGEQEPFDEHFARRLVFASAAQQIGYLAHYVREGNHEEAVPLLRAIRETVDTWRRSAS
jgi:Ser/Thr protein kinase RdoA (MazF antagonist)